MSSLDGIETVARQNSPSADNANANANANANGTAAEARSRLPSRWWHWFGPDLSRQDKWLIFKLDLYILLYTCATFFIKTLDQTNVTNAYVSGMKKDLHLFGNELNWFTTYFNIGTIVGSTFATFILTVVRANYWLPALTALWSICVLFMYKANNPQTIYALRFLAGLFESGAYPGAFYIIGSWYTKSEIARRAALFLFSSAAGQMFSGYIQAGLYGGMNGRLGLAAWRWLFIFDCILGVPVALFGLLCCPDHPASSKPWWMSKTEQMRSQERLATEGRDIQEKLDWSVLRNIAGSWQFWAFGLGYGVMELTCGTEVQRWMTLFLSWTERYGVQQVNAIPTAVGAMKLIMLLITGIIADSTQNFVLPIFFCALATLGAYIVFAIFPFNDGALIAMYLIAAAESSLPLLMLAWTNLACGNDRYLRAATTGFSVTMGYVCETLTQQFLFPVSDAPRYKRTGGYIWGCAFVAVTILWWCFGIPFVIRQAEKRLMKANVSPVLDKTEESSICTSATFFQASSRTSRREKADVIADSGPITGAKASRS